MARRPSRDPTRQESDTFNFRGTRRIVSQRTGTAPSSIQMSRLLRKTKTDGSSGEVAELCQNQAVLRVAAVAYQPGTCRGVADPTARDLMEWSLASGKGREREVGFHGCFGAQPGPLSVRGGPEPADIIAVKWSGGKRPYRQQIEREVGNRSPIRRPARRGRVQNAGLTSRHSLYLPRTRGWPHRRGS